MSYTEDIVRPLIETLSRTAGLPTFQLAGHVPNLTFWVGEVRHALTVIEGYPRRFEAMVAAQNAFDVDHPEDVKRRTQHEYRYEPPRLAVSRALAERLTRELIASTNRLIDRCIKEELIDIVRADDLREGLRARDTRAN